MKIGVPKELKDHESRVGLTPAGAAALAAAGHQITVETGAGADCGFDDAQYAAAGARVADAAAAWDCDLVVKVKEPQPSEHDYLRGQILLAYLHLAGAPRELTEALLRSRTTGIAYETIEDANGRFPLLAPMSEIAGSMAPLMGAYYLAKHRGGRGTLLGRLHGERHGRVAVVGDGVVGRHACNVASGLGANVTVFGIVAANAATYDEPERGTRWRESTVENLEEELAATDLLIGAVLRPGARAPHVVTTRMVQRMPRGSVIVDVSIDQGGCIESSRPTSHSDPVFVAHGVIHYCVTNMPGAYPRTSTEALTAATLPYVIELAAGGREALRRPGLARGVNVHAGHITHAAVAETFEMADRYRRIEDLLG